MTPETIETLDFVRGHIERMGFAPTYPEIAGHFRITPSAAFHRVEQLVEAGHLRKTPSRKRGLDLVAPVDLRALASSALAAELKRRGEMVGALSRPVRRVMGRGSVSCAVDCCDIEVPMGHLMCWDHWTALPWGLREDIKAAHRTAKRTGARKDGDRFLELVDRAKSLAVRQVAA